MKLIMREKFKIKQFVVQVNLHLNHYIENKITVKHCSNKKCNFRLFILNLKDYNNIRREE